MIPVDPKEFYRACNPSLTLDVANENDRKLYIDFSPARGGEIIGDVCNNITWSGEDASCQLFSGHIGCGKSTELLRLKAQLETKGDQGIPGRLLTGRKDHQWRFQV